MFSDKPPKVGVIGLGIIGSRVADSLRKANAHVYVWSRTPKPEPNFLSSPAEVAALAEVIQIFVTNGEALLEVLAALEPKLTKKHIIINSSTVDPLSTDKAAQLVENTGAAFLDCPFTGSKLAAEKGALVYYVGGDLRHLEQVRHILEISAKEIVPVGGIGDATILKIATNMITSTTVQVLSEAYALTKACGIDPEKLAEAVENNACGSPLTAMKLPTIIAENYEPHFSLQNMFKDAQFALNLANQKKVDMPALSTTASVMFKSLQRGFGEEDFSVIARNYQDPPPAALPGATGKTSSTAGSSSASAAAPADDLDAAIPKNPIAAATSTANQTPESSTDD